ncbi:zinc transporter ZntB [Vibrio sp. PP-XX7]
MPYNLMEPAVFSNDNGRSYSIGPMPKKTSRLHFDYDDAESQQWITEQSGLNEITIDGLISEDSRPHVLTRNNNLLAIFRGVNLNPDSQPEDMISLRVWTDGRRLISTQRRRLISTEDVLASLNEATGPKTIPALLIDWVERIVTRMSDTVDKLEDDLYDIESMLDTSDPREIRPAILRLRRQSIGIRRYLAPQREAINHLIDKQLNWMDDLDRLRLKSISDRQIRHIESIDMLTERASMVQDELINRMSEEINQRSYVLTIVAAIFLPLGFFTGLMGINVGGMPGVNDPGAFWIVVLICVVIFVLLGSIFYWKKWF